MLTCVTRSDAQIIADALQSGLLAVASAIGTLSSRSIGGSDERTSEKRHHNDDDDDRVRGGGERKTADKRRRDKDVDDGHYDDSDQHPPSPPAPPSRNRFADESRAAPPPSNAVSDPANLMFVDGPYEALVDFPLASGLDAGCVGWTLAFSSSANAGTDS